MMRRAYKTRRGGYTIIEMVTLLGVFMLVATAGYRSLNLTTRITKQHQQDRLERLELQRFAKALRADVRGAQLSQSDQWPVTIDTNKHKIQYRYDAELQSVLRLVGSADSPIGVDRFAVPSTLVANGFANEAMVRVSLVLQSNEAASANSTGQNNVNYVIEATP